MFCRKCANCLTWNISVYLQPSQFFLFKKWAIRSFPHFWWAMWANCSGYSPKISDVSESLRSLTKNEQWWAICSGFSPKMSDVEQFAQVAHQKWATMSESLRSLTKNERMSESLVFFSESLIRSFLDKKQAVRSENRCANSQPWGKVSNL